MAAQLFIVTAPSGAGKTSIVREVLARTDRLEVSVSHTTRLMRPADRDGIDYHFIDQSQFQQMAQEGDFLEHAEVFGNRYGTARSSVAQLLECGTDVLLEIDWQGAEQIRKLYPGCVSMFILPPSLDTLAQRLTGRASDSAEVIRRRLSEALLDMQQHRHSDYLVINDDFEQAVNEVCCVVSAERLKTTQQVQRHTALLREMLG